MKNSNSIMKRTIILLCAAALVCSCARNAGQQQMAFEAQTPKVEVAVAATQMVAHEGVYSATVQANVTNNIAPQSGSRIQKILVDVGDFVNAGQVVAEMDRVQLEQAGLNLSNSETELERMRQLYEQGGVSKSDFEAMELSVKVARTSYANLLENTVLRSPVSGVVTARNYDRGDMYAMSAPIFTVQQITPVKILVAVSESDYGRVHKGDKVSLVADALPGQEFTGTINRIYPTIDPVSHTVNVEVRVANEKRLLRPGMYARVTLVFDEQERVVLPDGAIVKQQGSGQRSVYILGEDNTVSLRVVELGRHFGGNYEIISGVQPGEKVVVKGLTALRSGVTVEVI